MPDRFYGMALGGQRVDQVTEQATTTSAVVELRVNDTVYANKLQVILAVEGLLKYLKHRETTPIA